MSTRVRIRAVVLILALIGPPAFAYIHFPPMTLPKMCKQSHHIRLLKVAKCDKSKGVIVFEVAEALKGEKSSITSFRHVIRAGAQGAKPILDWVAEGRTAVMFSIETKPGFAAMGIAYVFIDEHCYSAVYNRAGSYWLVIRGEPDLSPCYHGSAKVLREAVKDFSPARRSRRRPRNRRPRKIARSGMRKSMTC
jgi:hypothetical protein